MHDDQGRAVEADCARLIRLYANLADAGRWGEVAAPCTEDGRFARPSRPGEFVAGRAAILASFTARSPRPQRHVFANVVVGSYIDRLVRIAEGWRFAERVGALDFRP